MSQYNCNLRYKELRTNCKATFSNTKILDQQFFEGAHTCQERDENTALKGNHRLHLP